MPKDMPYKSYYYFFLSKKRITEQVRNNVEKGTYAGNKNILRKPYNDSRLALFLLHI
jgi:hypothetical protein